MKNNIKLAAIHSDYGTMPLEANPYSTSFDYSAAQKYVAGNIERVLKLLCEAGRDKVDIVTTTEDFKGFSHYVSCMEKPEIFKSLAETIPGPTTESLGEVARQFGMYISANCYEKDREKLYNTTVLIGRDGLIIGKYRKVHLPAVERWMVTPGRELPVYDTDIGSIGFATCYDIEFPEHCRCVALKGADIILHPTQGWGMTVGNVGEALVRVRAAENSVCIIVAKSIPYGYGGKSCIVDNSGNILAERSGGEEGIISAEIIPDYDLYAPQHFDAFYSGVDCVRARLALERQQPVYTMINEEKPPLLARYKSKELKAGKDKALETARLLREHYEAEFEKKPGRLNYHW